MEKQKKLNPRWLTPTIVVVAIILSGGIAGVFKDILLFTIIFFVTYAIGTITYDIIIKYKNKPRGDIK